MTDRIFINNLKVDTIIGVFNWERQVRQTLCIDLEMAANIKEAAYTDALGDTLDYHAISLRLTQFVEDSRFELIETLAESITELLQNEFNIPWLKLRLSKPGAIANADNVGVIIERGTA